MNNPQESINHFKDDDFRTIEQTMEKLSGGTRRLAAQLTTSASFDSLWCVLTDYDRLNLYIPNLLSSKKIYQKNNNVHLKQVGAQDFLGMKFSAFETVGFFGSTDFDSGFFVFASSTNFKALLLKVVSIK